MQDRADTSARVAFERSRRGRMGVPVAAAGVVYLIGAILVYRVFMGLHPVGLLQALQPALGGKAAATISPRAAEIRYLSHHSLGLIAGGVLQGIAYAALAALLVFLLSSVRARAPEPSPAARLLVLIGGAGTAVIVVASEVLRAVRAHEFVTAGHLGEHAVEQAVSAGAVNMIVGNLALLLPIVLVVGMIMALLRAARVGLVPRWLRGFGILAAVIVLPMFASASILQVIPAVWLVFMGMLLLGRLPGGDPPAWERGEAVPWPQTGSRGLAGAPAPAGAALLSGKGKPAVATAGASGANGGGGASGGKAVAEGRATASANGSTRGGRAAAGSGGSRRSRKRKR